ncbi:MAG: hypothetical protein RLY35_1113 [Bacteroidota bacterium]
MKKGLFILGAGLMLMASCGKFEEGPGFTLRSKKARLSGNWKLKEITVNGSTSYNGQPLLDASYEMLFDFTKDGKFTFTEKYLNSATNYSNNGTWEFKDDSLITKSLGDDNIEDREGLHIVRLTNSEFWIDETDSTEKWVYKFEQE